MNKETLEFLTHIAHHPSGNFHTWYPKDVRRARELVKAAGGELREIGRFLAGESTPMGDAEYERRKDERKVERAHRALLLGPLRYASDDIYDVEGKRVCTHSEFSWIRRWLEKLGVRVIQHEELPKLTWEIHKPENAKDQQAAA